MHPKRGSQAMDELGFFPFYTGTVVHDCLPAYFKEIYSFDHALCNAHLLRECQGIAEHDGHEWAIQMKELLQESWKLAQSSRQEDIPLPKDVIEGMKDRYDDILESGKTEWEKDAVRAKTGLRGRKIKSKAANLGERFLIHKGRLSGFFGLTTSRLTTIRQNVICVWLKSNRRFPARSARSQVQKTLQECAV
ncbi:transposase [Paenibacillus sp. S3N08]|uniref:Transposase n=1 Tax=Paenibacillus agricola TaxID=2716264 RepID=A0ABX0JG89_9BACL|nr:transposase [Paenibacillus agricola]